MAYRQQWEYLSVSWEFIRGELRPRFKGDTPASESDGLTMIEYFNQLGRQGWELMSPPTPPLNTYLFKRAYSEDHSHSADSAMSYVAAE
jgi:hypothetical protein